MALYFLRLTFFLLVGKNVVIPMEPQNVIIFNKE